MQPGLFYVGLEALIVQDGCLLMLQRLKREGISHWDLPGGRMAAGEDLRATLFRELQEEIQGIADVTVKSVVHVHQLTTFKPDGNSLFLAFFLVEATLPSQLVTPDHSYPRWLSKTEIEALPDLPELQFEEGYRAAALKALQ